ncbi:MULTISPECIES: AMP-binding protein [unclassified Micromonospora]|uniref:AMP-binding protein n=1 Tax=unclassified Micromonospora TaxID=2617518 RepID=UPI0022B72161|nr:MULTISPECIES: AMP-binding protein [unclassified Micromonospora]MCZ7421231.1 AMP-binding protein [Verrucosispora sp. WMMA2121]WBB94070.1 AMP-binding protein [Verrucosispora sp. WMMC514]
MNLAATLARRCAERGWADRPAVREPGRTWSHGAIHDLAGRAARVLTTEGIRPGDRVLLALPDSAAWVVSFLAVARAGAVAVLVNPALAAPEHTALVADCAPALVLCPESLADRFTVRTLSPNQLLDRAGRVSRAPAVPVAGSDPLYVQYTSGTTGDPKGAVHRHTDPEAYYRSAGLGVVCSNADDVTLSISKLHFAYGFGNAFVFPLFSGSSAVLLPERPSPEAVAELVTEHRVTLLYGVPTSYAQLVAARDRAAFGSVRAAVSAGEALRPDLAVRAEELLGVPLLNQVGSTEAGHAFCANTVDEHRIGTVGRPVPGYRLRLLDSDGVAVPDEVEGELWVTGETVMTGYLNRPQETARTLVGGWLRTRDLAVRHGDGTYALHGRVDDLEMVGGITLAPQPVEHLIEEHPTVAEAAVVARTDRTGASRLHAFVVPVPGAATPTVDELARWLDGRVAPFKVPRGVTRLAALPRTPTGKLRRFALREQDTREQRGAGTATRERTGVERPDARTAGRAGVA